MNTPALETECLIFKKRAVKKEPDEYTGIRNRAFDFEKIHGTGYGGTVSYPSG